MKSFEEKSASERGGIARYETRSGRYGPTVVITYKNGDKVWKVCEECWLNGNDPSRLIKNGGKFVKCLGCHARELKEKR